jgi:hypothetical protein
MKGIDSLGFSITDPESITAENFTKLLDGIHTDIIELNFCRRAKQRRSCNQPYGSA